MFNYSFIDLDATIFETALFIQDAKKIFLSHNVKDSDFENSLSKAVYGENGNFYNYNFENHVGVLSKEGYNLPTAIITDLNKLFKKNYQAKDVEKFLKFIKKISHKTILLSIGDVDLQKRKISSAQVENFFDEIYIIHEKKEDLLKQKNLNQENFLFINDNVKENSLIKEKFPNALIVARLNPRKEEVEYRASGIPYFKTLIEIKQYVEQQLK
jgi:FMN phosphatase YigB (HAD superfamily)